MIFELNAYGERGWLVNGLAAVDRYVIEAALLGNSPAHYEEHVLGYSNVLLIFNQPVAKADLKVWLSGIDFEAGAKLKRARVHEVSVCYDGPDLEAVAKLAGLSVQELITVHSEASYTVRMMGFTPGFPYLDGLDPRLQVDRRGSPRNRIAPGAVAIGGPHAGIYSVASPGGWHLLGHAELALFQPKNARGDVIDVGEVFAMEPGDRVQFVPLS